MAEFKGSVYGSPIDSRVEGIWNKGVEPGRDPTMSQELRAEGIDPFELVRYLRKLNLINPEDPNLHP
ncbi:MAG: hypothetical protein Q7S60_03120 [bacterium]|nr:hypothetical protein [bacterium]